ncbi:MAG: hypothetical protein IPL61_23620 [Myxococcales bacterium]|nr:hypothetical protein [Myxococcales bacterium]
MVSRTLVIACALAVGACGGGGSAVDAGASDAQGDGAVSADGGDADGGGPDGAQACVAWSPAARPATAIAIHDDPGPFTSARTVRIVVEYPAAAAELAAMPVVTRGAGVVAIQPMVFAPDRGAGGPIETRRLIVPLVLPVGVWRIEGVAPTPPTVALTIGPAPLRPCGTTGACAMDCDCDEAAGERCLGGVGLGGGFTACARPCEVDRDCGGGATCASIPDGLWDTCSDLAPECSATVACPLGFACQAGTCAPTFVLGQGSRHPCGCDADCEPGLRCVAATPTDAGRCEVACATGGPWCQGAHVCGSASADLSGLATTDSVCGWLGE